MPRWPQHLLLALPLALPPLSGATCEPEKGPSTVYSSQTSSSSSSASSSPTSSPETGPKISSPAATKTAPVPPVPAPVPIRRPNPTPQTNPCDKWNTAAFRTLNWSARRSSCNSMPGCTFTGRSVTGHCWSARELAEHETEVYLKGKELERRITRRIERMEKEEEREDNSEEARRSKYFVEPPPEPTSSDVYASILSSDALSQVRSLTLASLNAVQSGDTDYHQNPEKVSFRDLKQAGFQVQEDVREVLREDLRKAVAEKTADNIKERQAQAKEVAGELINKTLADPELPKKVGGFLTGILAAPQISQALPGLISRNLLSQKWLGDMFYGVTKPAVGWWLVKDQDLVLQKQLVGLAKWLIPGPVVYGLAKNTTVWLLLPGGPLQGSFTTLVAETAIPNLNFSVENALSEQIRWMCKDEWYKDYVKKAVLARMEEIRDQNSVTAKRKEKQGEGKEGKQEGEEKQQEEEKS
ncbi:hypothetical protein TrST_g1000 [Triparma strigata]|uniref:Uncharacterized protein n=1 Tax=Triparma strigata TaxID=1606541 RepID=A0A9W6ZXQ6_9STRA|nr:hypothetical protein TrST_g1000 [Triparma strigata]